MYKNKNFERRGKRPQRSNRRKNRHPGLAENQPKRRLESPEGEIPHEFSQTVFGKLNPLLQHAAVKEGFKTPTPVQEQSIPHLLEGRDIFGCAQTGTGKTAAFLLPILERFLVSGGRPQPGRPRALIVAPTRELAAQIAESTVIFSRYTRISFAVIFGGVSQVPQVKALKHGADVVVATPGRLIDLMEQGHISLENVECFVLDEADRLLDMGFLPDIRKIQAKLPDGRQTMFFSATLSKEVMKLSESMVKDPAHVNIAPEEPTVDKINQSLMFVGKGKKTNLLVWLLQNKPEMKRVIVFVRMRYVTDNIADKLRKEGITAQAIHSDKTQRMRTNTLNGFRTGRIRVLTATDIASRGIDVSDVTHVVNYDLPEETESYVHRIGRTARAGSEGAAISFISKNQRNLLRDIEKLIKKEIPREREQPYHSEEVEESLLSGGDEKKTKTRGNFKRFRKERDPKRGKMRGQVKPDRTRKFKSGAKKKSGSAAAEDKSANSAGLSKSAAKSVTEKTQSSSSAKSAAHHPEIKGKARIRKQRNTPPWMR
ncbi:MAG: DEAD/DEAH box helicase [Kiritimatiellia bacterium]